MNDPVKPGDRIVLLHMVGETSVTPGRKGTVQSISRDPFENDGNIISVKWDNGSTLSILDTVDYYKKLPEKVDEQLSRNQMGSFVVKNKDLFDNFDWKMIKEFLNHLRESGVTNMLGAVPFMISGKNWIERYYGENVPNPDAFEKVLKMADDVKNELISGSLKKIQSDKSSDNIELEKVERYVKQYARKFMSLFMVFG
jgi:hypothetical protein